MPHASRMTAAVTIAAFAGFALAAPVTYGQPRRATLTGFAVLPANTFAPGPPSGAWTQAGREGTPQFPSQPVQGVSALWPAGAGDWWALVDNGFGAKINSPDALLRIYRLRVTFASAAGGGRGRVDVDPAFIQLADPDRRLPFRIVNEGTRDRLLTGSDLDPEAFVRAADGTFWIGDEFGPFVVHVDALGKVLAPPFEVPGLRSPDHPHMQPADAGQTSAAQVRRSRGFEGLAAAPGNRLFAALESAGVTARGRSDAPVYPFDLGRHAFGEPLVLPLDEGLAVTELIGLEAIFGKACAGLFLAVERDDGHGPDAKIKRVHRVRLGTARPVKELVVDLLDIDNPGGLGGFAARFTFPYVTTEAVWPIDRQTLVLANDNNFPAGGGRPGATRDVTEFIRVRLAQPLCA